VTRFSPRSAVAIVKELGELLAKRLVALALNGSFE
jgi:hypothetical protein